MPLKPRNVIDADDPRVSQIGHPAPPWMISYADLMTELVCFFVILYALSAALNKNVQQAKERIDEMMDKEKIEGKVEVKKDGMMITFQEKGEMSFFESGHSEMTEQMKNLLDTVAPEIRKLANQFDILVEGHTDNIPIHTVRFASNWELSTARATEVVHYLTGQHGVAPEHMAAVGYGEFKPVHPNNTLENRARNRRVVFFVKTNTDKIGESKKEKKEGGKDE